MVCDFKKNWKEQNNYFVSFPSLIAFRRFFSLLDGTIIAKEDLSLVGASIVDLMITVDDGFNTVGPLTLSVTITGIHQSSKE